MCLCRQKDACGANGRGYAVHAPSANAGNVSIFYSQGTPSPVNRPPPTNRPHNPKREHRAHPAPSAPKKLLTMP